MHSVGLKEQFEDIGCPLGCASESSHVAMGKDRLHHSRAGILHVVGAAPVKATLKEVRTCYSIYSGRRSNTE